MTINFRENVSSISRDEIKNFGEFSVRVLKISVYSAAIIICYCLIAPYLIHALQSSAICLRCCIYGKPQTV